MRPTNTWDLYAYLPLTAIIVGYALFKSCFSTRKNTDYTEQNFESAEKNKNSFSPCTPRNSVYKSLLYALAGMAALTAFATLFYQPYIAAFGQAYGDIRLWEGTHTPLSSYFTQWGLFLFVIVSWMWWETYEWMAATPLSALKKLQPHRSLLNVIAAAILALLIGLAYLGVNIGWIAVPLALWAGVLLIRPDLDEGKRLVLFLIGTALSLTIVVEVIVLAGDIGRMNTVFKLYLQAWTFLAISAGASLGWLLPKVATWTERWQSSWKTVGMVLLTGALLFTITGTLDKVRDRTASNAPMGLDGMKYMETGHHWDGEELDLGQDYAAIMWMRKNVQGSPTIVEANTPEYRWGSRYSIYTGLPGVLGWNWHQRQQRALNPPNLVTDRVEEIKVFYETNDLGEALAFIEKYHIKYIVVGQVEQNYYPGFGLDKFEQQNGVLWDEVFREEETRVYEVR